MTKIQLDRELTRKLIVNLTPMYAEMLRDLQSPGLWAKILRKYDDLFRGAGAAAYVSLFDDERKIHLTLWYALLGEDGFKGLNAEVAAMSPPEQQTWVNELIADANQDEAWSWMEPMFPATPEKEEAARREYEALGENEKAEALKRSGYFWAFFFASFHNLLSVMLHGRKLTLLVAQAKARDETSFCMAVHIEPRLLQHHPYFRERHLQAQEGRETDFLKRLGNALTKPPLTGRIQYPGLYMLFAMLEFAGWLDGGFTREELLDICDEAGLDRYQDRIEDTVALTKCLGEYRRWQKANKLSMQ